MADQTNSIEVEGLVRVFKDGPRAVDGIDLHVSPGEIYGFLGPNGAGKSTTVLMLTTLLPPTGGRASVGGFDVVPQGPEVRRLLLDTDLTRLAGSRPAADRFVYTVAVGEWQLTVPEQDLTPELDQVVRIVLGGSGRLDLG